MSNLPQQALDFISGISPWESLTHPERVAFVSAAKLIYLNEDSLPLLQAQQEAGNGLLLIQTGEFEVQSRDAQDQISGRYISESEYVFLCANPFHIPVENLVKVHSPGLVYCLDVAALIKLSDQTRAVQRFFTDLAHSIHYDNQPFQSAEWQEASLLQLCHRPLVQVTPDTSVAQCAELMTECNVSSVLVCEGETLQGILTDKDLRTRVLARHLSSDVAVSEVMTTHLQVASPQQDWLDAVCLMSESGFSHVPIVDEDYRPVGIMTKSDVINRQKSNIVWLIKSLSRATSLYELMQHAWQIPHYIRFNMQGKQGFANVGQWLARATDVMTRRLLHFYFREHGEPPFAWCWLVYGSQARKDQLLTSDQDNGLLLAQVPDTGQADYFRAMAQYVCNGLAKCGIALCNGNIMASNPELRKTLQEAVVEAEQCVSEPSSERLLHFNIFLDVRLVQGSETLFAQLQSRRAELFKKPLFLAALAREVNRCEVPLSLFQRFIYEDNEHKKAINLKVNAVAIVNSIVRLYALSVGLKVASTPERLAALSESGLLSSRDCANLKSIWLYLNELRLNSQLDQQKPDNLVDIRQLTPMEKYQLKKAFQSIKKAQSALLLKFSSGLGG